MRDRLESDAWQVDDGIVQSANRTRKAAPTTGEVHEVIAQLTLATFHQAKPWSNLFVNGHMRSQLL